MPHATHDDTIDGADEAATIQRYLNDQDHGGDDIFNRPFDQRDKAADAVDYEDISDDDELPEEEEATSRLADQSDASYSQIPGSLGALAPVPQANGYHHAPDQHSSEPGMEDDLFRERIMSPEHTRKSNAPAPQVRPSGLALPSKTGLALPSYAGSYPRSRPEEQLIQFVSSSASPPSLQEYEYSQLSPASLPDGEDEFIGLTPEERKQRELFRASKRRQAGEKFDDEQSDLDMDLFYSLFPSYDFDQNPRFIDFFPQRPVAYRGKVPLKPPRPVQANKVSLDFLPDQERSFRSATAVKSAHDSAHGANLVSTDRAQASQDESEDDLALNIFDENERLGAVELGDLAIICQNWDDTVTDGAAILAGAGLDDLLMDESWDANLMQHPSKRRKLDQPGNDIFAYGSEFQLTFEDPERASAKLAQSVILDLNDPYLLIDEAGPSGNKIQQRRVDTLSRDPHAVQRLAKIYNVSNDAAYDLLKENHKVRSMLGGMVLEHSLPAARLQYPFYKIQLETKAKRNFHRPGLELRDPKREYRFSKFAKPMKRKHLKSRATQDLFSTSESLALNDNSSVLLLEYSEEAPVMMSNFGMASRLINWYRKRSADDQERPKRDIGDTQVLLTQDKSPFANFGHVDQGEVVPTVQNSLYRAPVFPHHPKSTDFLIAISTTYNDGSRLYLRNVENLHTVGQQLPLVEVPGSHSRKVTDAAKKRLRALSYRIHVKSLQPGRKDKVLDNASLLPHLPGHDMPQTRSKMREFMRYERMPNKEAGIWRPHREEEVPDAETLRTWIKPEEVCVLDSMQVGVQHLEDLRLQDKDNQDDKDDDLGEQEDIELLLAPWRATKNFLKASQGKAMLKLHGEGDPTGRGEGFSFVKTSMKGGFQSVGESVEDKLQKKKSRETGGHSYNVAQQQRAYDNDIRMIWNKQKQSLASELEVSDTEMEDPDAAPDTIDPFRRGGTPRSSVAGTPVPFGRRDDETMTQHSRGSMAREADRVLIIERRGGRDKWGQPIEGTHTEFLTDPKVIKEYRKLRRERLAGKHGLIDLDAKELSTKGPYDNDEITQILSERMREEIERVERNIDRRVARERQKAKVAAVGKPASATASSPPAAGSDGETSSTATPQKGRGRNKEGTARKCANCGQVGHIKTNRKSVCPFLCLFCGEEDKNMLGKKNGRGGKASAAATSASGSGIGSGVAFKS